MTLKLTILGCGTSGGVPRVGNIWGACDSSNPKNRRRRCSVLVQKEGGEGTTNVLSLDTLRALKQDGVFEAFVGEMRGRLERATDARLQACSERGRSALEHAGRWLSSTVAERDLLEAGARRFALTLGRVAELALLVDHAQWCLDEGKGERAVAAARRFARSRIDLIEDDDFMSESRLLVD